MAQNDYLLSLSKILWVYWAILLFHMIGGWDARTIEALDSTVGSVTGVGQRLDSLPKTSSCGCLECLRA